MNKTETSIQNNRPDYYVYHIEGNGRNSKWIKIGVAFNHSKGDGLNIILDALPFNFQGQLSLRKPKTQKN